jgi:hypothetical protein
MPQILPSSRRSRCQLPRRVASIRWSDERRSNKKSGILKWTVAFVMAIGSLVAAAVGAAAMEENAGSITALRLYLIWDDNGQMSKDVSGKSLRLRVTTRQYKRASTL